MQTDDTAAVVVPVIAEELEVKTRKVEAGRVVVTKEVSERAHAVQVPLSRERVHVERVAVNQVVAEPPAPRMEGETLVVPVIEEELVVTKRLVVKEELRITKTRWVEPSPDQHVVTRSEDVRVQRVPGSGARRGEEEGATS